MQQISQKLGDGEHSIKNVQFIMVSIDPERDTAERLRTFVTGFNKNFIGINGAKKELEAFSGQFHVSYKKEIQQSDKTAGYSFSHSSALFLINPRARLKGILSAPHAPARIVSEFTLLQSR